MLNSPVLFLIFNRPHLTKQSFATIRQAQPKQLFIAADGPRLDRPNEKELCEQTRKIVEEVDWECEVKTLFREKNLGCAEAVSSAITWFFEHVEEGIILEDDCVPSESFYTFCTELLDKYRNTPEVMVITGNNFQNGIKRGEADYYFSKFNHCWGWATWRSAWQYYDHEMSGEDEAIIRQFPVKQAEIDYWKACFDAVRNGLDSWAYRWLRSAWKQKGLTATPQVNLVSNIGFGEGATHCKVYSEGSIVKIKDITINKHPEEIRQAIVADIYTCKKHFGVKSYFAKKSSYFLSQSIYYYKRIKEILVDGN